MTDIDWRRVPVTRRRMRPNAIINGFICTLLIAGGCIVLGILADNAWPAEKCRTTVCLTKAVQWQQHDRAHLQLELARAKTDTPKLTVAYACKLGQVLTHVKAEHCERVVGCESGNSRTERNAETATGFAQFEDSTWAGTAFGKAGFSVYETLPNILQMDLIAATSGFDTRYGWAASYGCHHLSGREAS